MDVQLHRMKAMQRPTNGKYIKGGRGCANRNVRYAATPREPSPNEGEVGDLERMTGKDNALTGGFAGGEVGLKSFVKNNDVGPARSSKAGSSKRAPEPIGKGQDDIYIGSSEKKYLKDDQRLYPGKDNALTGGFAGGELGLKSFVESGEIPLRKKSANSKSQPTSPLLLAFGIGGAAALGSILLDPVTLKDELLGLLSINAGSSDSSGTVGEGLSSVVGGLGGIAQSSGSALNTQVILIGTGAIGTALLATYAYRSLTDAAASLVDKTKKGAVTLVFGLAVFKIALEILEK